MADQPSDKGNVVGESSDKLGLADHRSEEHVNAKLMLLLNQHSDKGLSTTSDPVKSLKSKGLADQHSDEGVSDKH